MNFLPREINEVNLILDQNSLQGDINFDDNLNILDVVIMVSFILGSEIPSGEEMLIADMNTDEIINVQDIILLVNEILNRN